MSPTVPDTPLPRLIAEPALARYDMAMRRCAECGQRLPRPLDGPGRLQEYCSPACRQKAYRRRGGRASGTTGAERARRARHSQPST